MSRKIVQLNEEVIKGEPKVTALDTPARPRYHVAKAASRFATYRLVNILLCFMPSGDNTESGIACLQHGLSADVR